MKTQNENATTNLNPEEGTSELQTKDQTANLAEIEGLCRDLIRECEDMRNAPAAFQGSIVERIGKLRTELASALAR